MRDFGRKIRLEIGEKGKDSISIENLRVDFSISKNDESSTNKSTVSIYNLNETTRQFVASSKELYMYVGYETSDTEYLFLYGENDRVIIEPNGLDILTTIDIEEGKEAINDSVFVKSYTKGTNKKKIILDALESIGLTKIIDKKYVNKILSVVDEIDSRLENGSTFCQKTKDVLDEFFKLVGISYSVQDGSLVVLGSDDTLGSDIYYITPSNGLIGNPVKTKIGCDITTMLLPELKIGVKINLDSKFIKGNFKVKEYAATGSTHGNQWEMSLKLKELKK